VTNSWAKTAFLAVLAVAWLQPLPAGAAGRGTVLVFGDSISAAYGIQRDQGWVALLAERVPDWQVVNASVSGETTGGGLARLPEALARHQPDLVILELGGNDALRGYPVARIRQNLTEMVRLARAEADGVLLLGMQIPPNYGPRYTRDFARAFREVAEAEAVVLVPFFLQEVALEPELMQDDGIHPTAAAQPLLLQAVWTKLAPLLDAAQSAQLPPAAGASALAAASAQ